MNNKNIADLLYGWAVDDLPRDLIVEGLNLDSRELRNGELFVALAGTQGHGLDFVEQAVQRGASGILYDPDELHLRALPEINVPWIAIPGLAEKIPLLASRYFGAPSEYLTLIGVTGTNGKSSVAHFTAQLWQALHGTAGFVGTLGWGRLGELQHSLRTTPDAFSLQSHLEHFVAHGIPRVAMEISSHALLQKRCETLQFDVAVFTNLSRDHLDYHQTMESYAAAKKQLFTDYRPAFSVINCDDRIGRDWINELSATQQILTYGLQPEHAPDVCGKIVAQTAYGMRLHITSPWGEAEVECELYGGFNAYNVLAAVASVAVLGERWEKIIHHVNLLRPVPGRMVKLGGSQYCPMIIVDYAHTPDALEQALRALRAHLNGRLHCLFGCGGNRDRGKRAEMGSIAEQLADVVWLTSDNPRYEEPQAIIDDVLGGIQAPDKVNVELDRAAAIKTVIQTAAPEDMILVAGRGHEQYQEINGLRLPFSDEAQILNALERAA